ncbi:Calcineurin-like phosphoesterase [Roseimaritima multifibrata]|uniref:Calcineurin-like phosphoesterase n=1 Tax=Roseimaritima multifibrata TaxID=1930274 RepID=A0A517MND2_9BACT|nr:LamG-like jellyroll fold domain-containing protein [Roseimaritima multifibrata]QDS96398.1 Calcineurin-like phosphoesterase [Roseimaritima multifibrata]
MRFISLASACICLLLIPTAVKAHDPPGGPAGAHSHPHADANGHSHDHPHPPQTAPFTTRPDTRVLPLAKDEQVFHFAIYGDRTGGVPAGLKVLEQAVKDTNLLDPDLVMTVGDLVQGYNTTEEWMPQMTEFKEIMGKLKMQWFPVAGNHDVYYRGPAPIPEGQHEKSYEKHFGPLWYSFQHKNAGFIVLYSDEGDRETNRKGFNAGELQTMSPEQLEFLQQALESLSGLDHVFVFLHHPRWIGGGYTGGNWDKVHEKLKTAGNVSAVFAGHIHHMRYDGEKDDIAYYTLATTGGNLSADIPDAGYLHHMNIVTVRPDTISVAALPIGAVIDPKEFTPEFTKQIGLARSVRPIEKKNDVLLSLDGTATGTVIFQLKNPSDRPVEGTASLVAGSSWSTSLDHQHFEIAAGQEIEFPVQLRRIAGSDFDVTLPQIQIELEMVGESSRVKLPATMTPIKLRMAGVPADYFTNQNNLCLDVRNEKSVARIDSSELKLPNGPMTLEAWVRPTQSEGHRGLIAKTEISEFALFMDEGVPQFDIHLNGKYVSAEAKSRLPLNEWSHVAGVYDGENVVLFVDGKKVASKKGTGKRKTNRLPLYVGADTDRGGQPSRSFIGLIDEMRLSSAAVYSDDFQPAKRLEPTDSTRILLHFDRSVGPFILDHSSNASTATLGRSAKLVPVPK